RALARAPVPAGAHVVGAAALAPQSRRPPCPAARTRGGDAGADVARDGRSLGSADGGHAPGAGARRPALERLCHTRSARAAGPAARTSAAHGAGYVSARGCYGTWASSAQRPARVAYPRAVRRDLSRITESH